MFKFARQREVMWPVTIRLPVDGGVEEVEVGVRYRLLTRDERKAMESLASDAEAEAFLMEHITGWDERWGDDEGNPLPFSRENLAAVLQQPPIERALTMGLIQASVGAPPKNS